MSRGPSVLIAEDYTEFRKRILALLTPLNVICVQAANGRQAIEIVRNIGQVLDLVITDMDMPVHTGWEVIEATREHRGAGLPIIMQTGEAKYTYVKRRAAEFDIPLIDKQDIDTLLVPAVKVALRLDGVTP